MKTMNTYENATLSKKTRNVIPDHLKAKTDRIICCGYFYLFFNLDNISQIIYSISPT